MTEIKNESISLKIERAPGSKVKFNINVTPEATKAAYSKAIKNVNKEVTLPGFRKGKAPDALVVQNFAKYVDDEWNSVILNTAFSDAMKLSNIYPLTEKSINRPQIKSLSHENGAEIFVEFEALPEIPTINPADLTLKKIETQKVTEKDVEERLHDLQLNQAKWDDVTDRPIQDGDFVDLDIDSIDEPQQNICKDQRFVVSDGKIGHWLYTRLIGKNVGDTFEATSEKDNCKQCDDHTHVHPEEPEFKPTLCKISIKAIKKPELPAIDEEFAKKLGAEDSATLKERVAKSLENEAKEHVKDELRHQVEHKLIEKMQFDIPASLVKAQLAPALEYRLSQLKELGLPKESFEQRKRELEDQTLFEIINNYRMYFLCEKLAQDFKIEVTPDEIMQEFMVQAYMTKSGESFLTPNMDAQEIRSRINSYLLNRKVKDYIAEHARVE